MAIPHKILTLNADRTFRNLNEFFNYYRVAPPINDDLDIREADYEFQGRFKNKRFPLHHHLYCISIFLENGKVIRTALHGTTFDKPSTAFFAPGYEINKLISGDDRKVFYIIFTENFLARHRQLAVTVADLPFFQMGEESSYVTDSTEAALLANICNIIFEEYKSPYADRFDLLTSYIHILIAQIRRLYDRLAQTRISSPMGNDYQHQPLIDKFRTCVKRHIGSNKMPEEARFVNFYAEQLLVHPNHLNATMKRATGQAALTFIHQQIIEEAKLLLMETAMSVKEIAYRLAFKEPSHFNSFFRRNTNITPAAYRVRACA
jgi:AraC family transcriptional regulator, transcriptional activator of pobA